MDALGLEWGQGSVTADCSEFAKGAKRAKKIEKSKKSENAEAHWESSLRCLCVLES